MAVIKDKKCMIIGAAPLASGAVFEEFDPKEHYVICADAGYDTAVQYGVRPDLVIGDFDSAAKRPPETIRTIKLPVEKDVTDMMGAVMVGQKLGYKTFVLIGGLGGAVAEFLSENCPTPLVRHGVNDAFGRSGTANAVLEAYGLTPEVLCDKIREALAKKH